MHYSDLHTHSWLSIDGDEPVEALCAAAVAQDLSAIAITDHWDGFLPGVRDAGYAPHFMDSRDFWALHGAKLKPEIDAARDRYEGKLRIVYGVELGQPQFDPAETREFLSQYDFDFVLCSQHLNRDCKDYYTLDYTGLDIDALLRDCFRMEQEVIRSGAADALAHIDQPIRLLKGLGYDTSLRPFREEIDALLRDAVEYGVPLEINTHGLRNWYGRVTPPEWALRRYRELGGELVTLGSDAHSADAIGAGIREAKAIAEACGLRAITYFDRRQPVVLD